MICKFNININILKINININISKTYANFKFIDDIEFHIVIAMRGGFPQFQDGFRHFPP